MAASCRPPPYLTAPAALRITKVKWRGEMTKGSLFTLMKYPGKNARNNGKPISFCPRPSCREPFYTRGGAVALLEALSHQRQHYRFLVNHRNDRKALSRNSASVGLFYILLRNIEKKNKQKKNPSLLLTLYSFYLGLSTSGYLFIFFPDKVSLCSLAVLTVTL